MSLAIPMMVSNSFADDSKLDSEVSGDISADQQACERMPPSMWEYNEWYIDAGITPPDYEFDDISACLRYSMSEAVEFSKEIEKMIDEKDFDELAGYKKINKDYYLQSLKVVLSDIPEIERFYNEEKTPSAEYVAAGAHIMFRAFAMAKMFANDLDLPVVLNDYTKINYSIYFMGHLAEQKVKDKYNKPLIKNYPSVFKPS